MSLLEPEQVQLVSPHRYARKTAQTADARGHSRRRFLLSTAAGALASLGIGIRRLVGQQPQLIQAAGDYDDTPAGQHVDAPHANAPHVDGVPMGHAMGVVGDVPTDDFDPGRFLTTWNFNDLPEPERAKQYRETLRPDGTYLREYEFVAFDKEIEIAPGVLFPAWTYNGQVPGPTIRATEGDRIRIHFINQGSHPHTIHFHGWHEPNMDGTFPDQFVLPGEEFLYEFDAEPVGVHLYHCHSSPLKRHIHKGLYGTYIVDPKLPRQKAHELVMVMNGFDTNFDSDNEVYAVNSVAFHYMHHPIEVPVGELVRVYLINLTEFDPVNSFHLHAAFFDVFRTGTRQQTDEFTDTVMLCQAERCILEFTLRYPGDYMFHAHQSEFAELGWMGVVKATPPTTA